MTANVMLSSIYQKSYKDIDGAVRAKVLDFIFKLMNNPESPALDLKTPQGVKDRQVKTGRVDLFWRAVLLTSPTGKDFVLVAVKPHDDAYEFAQKLRFGVNEVTGVFEIFDEEALEEAISKGQPTEASDRALPEGPILTDVKASDLKLFGVDPEIAEQLLQVVDEDALLEIISFLPDLQANVIGDLAAGKTVEDAWKDYLEEEAIPAAETVDTQDWEAAFKRSGSKLSFVDGADAEAMQAALEGDLAAWRVWLHPLQRKLAYHTGWNGPFRVTGGAGTGKTVTAIHRAKHLAESLGPDEKVLLTTFTRNLAETVREQLVELAGPEILSHVDVVNLDAVAQKVLASRQDASKGRRTRLVGDDDPEVQQTWQTARAACAHSWDWTFLQGEWSDVVLALGITDRAGYLAAPRAGRGVRLSRPQRADIWKAIEQFTTLLYADDLMTHTQAAAEAARLLDGAGEARYRHAIVDEAQDLHAAHWRLFRALVPSGTDDLFIVGDAHQRIYGRPLVLSRYGIETRGRSRRLTVNYRTSREILIWCSAVMQGTTVDDLEGGGDDLIGARSLFGGPEVEAVETPANGESDAAVNTVRTWHEEGIDWGEQAVVAVTNKSADNLCDALKAAGVPARRQGQKAVDEPPNQVSVMTMHRAKGLEFRAVAIVGIGKKQFPPAFAKSGDNREQAIQRYRSLLYVAGSRARERLALVWSGKPTEFLGG